MNLISKIEQPPWDLSSKTRIHRRWHSNAIVTLKWVTNILRALNCKDKHFQSIWRGGGGGGGGNIGVGTHYDGSKAQCNPCLCVCVGGGEDGVVERGEGGGFKVMSKQVSQNPIYWASSERHTWHFIDFCRCSIFFFILYLSVENIFSCQRKPRMLTKVPPTFVSQVPVNLYGIEKIII